MTFNPMSLVGKTFLLTGASSGLGRETAIILSKLGARLALVARNTIRLEETYSKLESKGHKIYTFDLEQLDEIPGLLKTIAEEIGPLSGIFHAAGIAPVLSIKSAKEKSIIPSFKSSIFASLMLAKGFCQKGIQAEGMASLVFMSSAASITGSKGLSVYSASKAAVDGSVRALAVELAEKNIRVNSVAAGMIKTEMHAAITDNMSSEMLKDREGHHPLGFGEPIDVAMAVAFLLSDASKWITGTTMVVDGGFSISK